MSPFGHLEFMEKFKPGKTGWLFEASRATRKLLNHWEMGFRAGPRVREVWASRSRVVARTFEQVKAAEAGIFCAVLNTAPRKLGLILTWSLGYQLFLVTQRKPLSLSHKQMQHWDQERRAKEVLWIEGSRTLKPGHPRKRNLGLSSGDKAAGQAALPSKQTAYSVPWPTPNYICWALSLFAKYKRTILNWLTMN